MGGRGSPAPGPPSWRKVWGQSGWGRGKRRGSGGGAARRGEGERASGPKRVRRRRRPWRRKRLRGCGRRGELLPRSFTPSAQLLEPRAGRGDVERSRAGEPPRAGPGRTPAPNVRGSLELCGGAAGVGARGGVHVGREGVAESGRCPVRPPLE